MVPDLHSRKVLATGVFDCLHQEHLNFLGKARAEGDFLVVGVESDARVRRLKGEGRPIQTQDRRGEALRKTGLVDQVILLPEKFDQPQDHRRFVRQVRPTVLAVSSHTPNLEAKRKIMAELGGEVKVVHQHNPKVSTTVFVSKAK